MFGKPKTLEVSTEELAVIEEALHTQSKIWDVQANAGGGEARARLNQIKRVLANVVQQKPRPDAETAPRKSGGFWMSRIFG